MNKNGWALFVLMLFFGNITSVSSSLNRIRVQPLTGIVFASLDILFYYFLCWYSLELIKKEHFKKIDNPNHWSHKAYQTYFIDKDLKWL